MKRLDELSKSLAESVPRRESLRLIGAALAGAVLSPLGVRTAWAAGPDRCLAFCRCANKAQQNQCLAACRACSGNTSRLCGTCGTYTCCSTSTACCNGACTSVNSDPRNCGACGNVCAASTPYCDQGVCRGCPEGATNCGGACIDTNWDSTNCGGCGIVCPPQFACSFGVCEGICIGCG
jgi:hypothetical protein